MPVRILPSIQKQNAPHYRDTKTEDERRFYSSQRWRVTSERHRQFEPLCRDCRGRGIITAGTLTDHIIAIRDGGDPWSPANHQTLCTACHNRKRKRESQRGGPAKK